MLVFHSHCQLGNQMFIYACACSLAKKKKQLYCLSKIEDLHYFKLSITDRYFNTIKHGWFRTINLFSKYKFAHYQDNRIDFSNIMLHEKAKNIWYYGYFQGEKYFFQNKYGIQKAFEIKEKYAVRFKNIRKKYCGSNKITVIHVRLKDYSTFGPDYLNGPDLTLPFSYYHKLIEKEVPKSHKIVFLSDSINTIKDEFSYVKNAYFSENSPIIDLQFLTNASVCVLSCSTFSWWGAWLNRDSKKKVYIPQYFLGHKVKKEFPINMIPSNWQTIAV